jgi:hypothetical protein
MTYIVPGTLPDTSAISSMLVIRQAFTAGAGGSADDVTIFSANAPFGFRIVDTRFYISTGVALATIQLRDATAGAGNALSDAIAAAATGSLLNTLRSSTSSISTGGTLVLRRSDNGVAGEVVIFLMKT